MHKQSEQNVRLVFQCVKMPVCMNKGFHLKKNGSNTGRQNSEQLL